jgi:hypothetical protein
MGLAMLHPSQPAAPTPADHIAAYLARVDAQLAATVDNGARATFLNGQLERWERLLALLLRWASGGLTGPNPVGPGATSWDVTETITGLCQRLARVEQAARDQIRESVH